MAESEVARLRQQIEAECEAMYRGLHGFAVTAKHDFIVRRYENLGRCINQLSNEVGREQAMDFVTQQLEQAAEAGSESHEGSTRQKEQKVLTREEGQ